MHSLPPDLLLAACFPPLLHLRPSSPPPHTAAQSQADAGSKARKQLQDLLARKAEAITRLQVLQQELEMANNLNPEGGRVRLGGWGCLREGVT